MVSVPPFLLYWGGWFWNRWEVGDVRIGSFLVLWKAVDDFSMHSGSGES